MIAQPLPKSAVWLPLAGMPFAVVMLCADWPPWLFMSALALSIFAGFKWLTLVDSDEFGQVSAWRSLGYLLFWTGMDAKSFLTSTQNVSRPGATEWLWAFVKTGFGLLLVFRIVPFIVDRHEMLAGWIGMAGIVFVLHFGLFHLLLLFWKRAGTDARPIMDAPIKASSLSDFWGRR